MIKRLIASSLIAFPLVLAGCSKKSNPPPDTNPPPAPPAAQTSTKSADTSTSAATTATNMMDSAKQQVTQAAEATKSESATPPAPTSEPAPAKTETTSESSGMSASNLVSSVTNGSTSIDDLKQKAMAMAEEYSSKVGTLDGNLALAKQAMDKAGITIPAAWTTKYNEAKTLVPQIQQLISEIKSYQGTNLTDLTKLTSKLQQDYSQAAQLYTELAALVPKGT